MSHRHTRRRTRFAAFALAALYAAAGTAAIDFVAPRPALAGDLEDDIKRFHERMKAATDAQSKRNAIAEIALKKDPKVAKALMKYMRDPDDLVKIAVAENIGEQNDPRMARMLVSIADHKANRDKPDLIAACLEGIGEADAKRNYKFLLDVAKKQMDYNGKVAVAAFRALGNHVHPQTVDDLVKQLAVADYVTTDDSAQKKAARGAAKGAIMDLLQKITKQRIKDAKVWKEWWDDNERGWKPPKDEAVDINASDTFEDSAYGFTITKPSRDWLFRKGTGDYPYITLEILDEGQRAAWIDVGVSGTKNKASKTPEALGEEMRPHIESSMRDIKEADWERPIRVAGEKGICQEILGQHSSQGAVWIYNVYIEHKQVMYSFRAMWKSGKSQALKDDIKEAIESLKLTR